MASLIKKPRSPYWWINWINPELGARQRFSTKLRCDDPAHTKKAKRLLLDYQAKELGNTSNRGKDQWQYWVASWLQTRYSSNARQYENVTLHWQHLEEYLSEREIKRPADLTRQHCFDFVTWKKERNPKININTTLIYLGRLRSIMSEAVKREYCTSNPASSLGIKEKAAKPRPEMTDAEIAIIRSHLQPNLPRRWGTSEEILHALRVSFEIGLLQGCRLSETQIDVVDDIDLENRSIRFHAKGDRYYETLLNPNLIPLIEELRKDGRRMSYDYSPRALSHKWVKVFKELGMSHLCFHCTRITAISKLERAGAPETVVMKLVNHASHTVHRIYRRHTKSELQKYWD
jgi:integrase